MLKNTERILAVIANDTQAMVVCADKWDGNPPDFLYFSMAESRLRVLSRAFAELGVIDDREGIMALVTAQEVYVGSPDADHEDDASGKAVISSGAAIKTKWLGLKPS